jgi:hypothetical protein
VVDVTLGFGNDPEGRGDVPGGSTPSYERNDHVSTLQHGGRARATARRNRSTTAGRLGRAVRWIDDWTVEAFNPVYPHRTGRK